MDQNRHIERLRGKLEELKRLTKAARSSVEDTKQTVARSKASLNAVKRTKL